MEIKSPSQQTIVEALRSRSAELAQEGKLKEAGSVRQDLVTLSKAPGDTLYEKHFQASETRKGGWPAHDSLGDYWNASPALCGLEVLGAAGVGVAIWNPNPVTLGAGLAVAAGVVAFHLVYARKAGQRGQAKQTLEAISRHQSYIANFTAASAKPPLNIERDAFIATLHGQEARLVEGNQYERAGDVRRLREGLDKVPGKTVDELFENLVADDSKKPLLALLQGSCSQPVFDSLQALAEVVKLTNPQVSRNLEESPTSVTVGGVVIKKRSA